MFGALHYSPVSRTVLDSDMHTKEREELSLQPQQLLFLLQDLCLKLSASLPSTGPRGLGAKVSKGRLQDDGVNIHVTTYRVGVVWVVAVGVALVVAAVVVVRFSCTLWSSWWPPWLARWPPSVSTSRAPVPSSRSAQLAQLVEHGTPNSRVV